MASDFDVLCVQCVSVICSFWLFSHPRGVTVSGAWHHSPRCFCDVLCLSRLFLCDISIKRNPVG